ncbi:MAG: metallophosphoesterase [Candidatus Polarisedimenticolia bacterium]
MTAPVRLFALADPHLSLARRKPMDVFGELWRDHAGRLAAAWDAAVGPDDVVLVAGDVSWARTLAEAAPDLAYLAARPGRLKLLLRGNHDSWWGSAAKVRAALPPTLAIMQHEALRLPEGIVVCGTRGWNLPSTPWFDEERDPALYRREVERLDLSLAEASRLRLPGDRLVAMLHYPPLGPGDETSEVLERLAAAGVELAVYGHLHGEDHAWAPQGVRRGVELRFVAVDYTGFAPVPLLER